MPYNTQIPGWMVEVELKVLESIAMSLPLNATIVEVGSMFGRSAVCWASTMPTATVYCIDSFYESYTQDTGISDDVSNICGFPLNGKTYDLLAEFTNNTKEFNNIKLVRGSCPTETVYTGNDIDLFFLDASHTNPNDWEILTHFIPLIKVNGILSGHDYSDEFPDVVENVRRLEKIIGTGVTLYPDSTVWSFTLTKKISYADLGL